MDATSMNEDSKPCKRGHTSGRYAHGACKQCAKDRVKLWVKENPDKVKVNYKKWRNENTEFEKSQNQKRYIENREAILERSSNYAKSNKEIIQANNKRWRSRNPDSYNIWKRKWLKTAIGKASYFMRGSLKRSLTNKTDRTHVLLGYTKDELITHLEAQFLEGMSWDNHGAWEIDHIKPVSLFLKENINDPSVINALDNLQPLWKDDNRQKGDSYDYSPRPDRHGL